MPLWTLDQLMSTATRRIGRRSDIDLSTCTFWANQAIQDVAGMGRQSLLESTTKFSVLSGTSLLTLPADFLEPIVLSLDTTATGAGDNFSARTVRPIAPEQADSRGYYPVAEPQAYFIFGDQIQLWPSANSSINSDGASSGRSYLLRYLARPSDLTLLTDVPSLDTEWRTVALLQLEGYLHEEVLNTQEAVVSFAKASALAASLKDAINRRQSARARFAASLPLRKGRRLFIDHHHRHTHDHS